MTAEEARTITEQVQARLFEQVKMEIKNEISKCASSGLDYLDYGGARVLLQNQRKELLNWLKSLGYLASNFHNGGNWIRITW